MNSPLYHGITNLIPFWSSSMISFLHLGNEYNMILNLVLSEILRHVHSNVEEDSFWLFVFIGFFIMVCLFRYPWKGMFTFFQPNTIELIGREVYHKEDIRLEYNHPMEAINHYLIHERRIQTKGYVNNHSVFISNLHQYRIHPSVYLTITRSKLNEETKLVKYQLWSYLSNVDTFLKNMVERYLSTMHSEILLIGSEKDQMLSYPEPIHAINYYIFRHNKHVKLRCMNTITPYTTMDKQTQSQSQSLPLADELSSDHKNSTYSYTLDNTSSIEIVTNLWLSIYRDHHHVYYRLYSSVTSCKEWLDHIMCQYRANKHKKFIYQLVLNGNEQISMSGTHYKRYYYSESMWALNWYIIEKLHYQYYEVVNGEDMTQYSNVLEPIDSFQMKEDLFLTIDKHVTFPFPNHISAQEQLNLLYHRDQNVTYLLNSNSLHVKSELDLIVQQFRVYKTQLKNDKTLYHFTYLGMKHNELLFNTHVLSKPNSSQELFETFDVLYHEHRDQLKQDLNQLRQLDYYKKHGLKRKKGYLFHGPPGCGKTSSVVAMALYDSRHIIEIPFHLLTSHDEFEKIMNLRSINQCDIDTSQIILLFDEIDHGMERLTSTLSVSNEHSLIRCCSNSTNAHTEHHHHYRIQLGSVLSKLDGIGNYNGLVIVATTNQIEQLNPAIYREMRLDPLYFQPLRRSDCIDIILSYFSPNHELSWDTIVIPDRVIYASKLIYLCHTHHHLSLSEFIHGPFQNLIDSLLELK